MHKLLLLGTVIGVGIGLAKFIKGKKEHTKETSAPIDSSTQPTPSVS